MRGETRSTELPRDDLSQLGLIAHEWRKAWRPGVAALVGGSLSYSLYSGVASLFVEPLQAQFGWSRGDIALVYSFGIITSFCAPFIGGLTDKFGVRPVLTIGLLLTALGYVLLATMPGSIDYYYVVYFYFSVVGMATTGITFTRILSGAFDRTRGTALAIGRSGLAVAGALMPFLLFPMISRYGTMGGYLTLGAFILFVALPLIWFWVPTKAADLASGANKGMVSERWNVLLKRPKVWILIVASALNYMPVVSLLSQMKPIAVSKGLDASMAAGAVSMMGLAAAVGALISGLLVDRFWAPAVAFILNAAPAIGCLFLLQENLSPLLFYLPVLLVGLGQGAEIDIVAFMIARYFGLRSYATIYGLSVLGISLSISAGASLIGFAYDRFGNYNVALMVASSSFALAALCYLAMGRYPAQRPD